MSLRKTALILAAAVLCAATTFAASQAESKAKGPKTLRYMFVSEIDAVRAVVDRYNKAHPDVQINLEFAATDWEGYNQKILTLVAGGTPPDIGWFADKMFYQFAYRGMLADLTPFVTKEIDLNKYDKNLFEEVKVNGKFYGLPAGVFTKTLIFNMGMFDKAGLAYPPTDWNKPWNYKELRAAALKLTKGEGAQKEFGLMFRPDVQGLSAYMFNNDAKILSTDKKKALLNDPASKEVFRFLQDMSVVDKTMPTSASEYKTMAYTELLAANKVAMRVTNNSCMNFFRKLPNFRLGNAALPVGRASTSSSVLLVDQYVVPKGSKYVAEAFAAIKEFLEEDSQNIMIDKNYGGFNILPKARNARVDDLFGPTVSAEFKQTWLKTLQIGKVMPFTPNWMEINEVIKKGLEVLMLGEKRSDDVADQMTAEIDALLKDNAKYGM